MKLFIFTHTYVSVTMYSVYTSNIYYYTHTHIMKCPTQSMSQLLYSLSRQRQWLLSTSLCWNHKEQMKLLLIILSWTLPSPFLCRKHISSSSNTWLNHDSHYSKWAWKSMTKYFPPTGGFQAPQAGPQPCHCSMIPVLITFWLLWLSIWKTLRKIMYFTDSFRR